jgi:hypothetical protein
MCRLARASRAGYYRHWQESAPRLEDRDYVCPANQASYWGIPRTKANPLSSSGSPW